ncbi:MAG: sensor hybrid histidine kinase [Candidatus Solibacter sp.]|jgi:two-component system cell cycle sensor histidine kinase/response regulator CckA|nr:sensor hybrid histidine kinase [Candidatus Solibacter sp.]
MLQNRRWGPDLISNSKSSDEHSESWVRSVLEALGDAIIVINAANRVEFMNLAAEKLTGMSLANGYGRSLSEVLHLAPEFGEEVRSDLFSLATINAASISLGRNLILRSDGGEERAVEGEVAPCQVRDSAPGAVVTFRDVTERRRREMAYSRDQKVRAVAQLAGSIAHDLNNALTLILGHTDELAFRVAEDDPARRAVEALQDAGDMACKISDQLRLLSRKEILLPTVLNLNRLIEESFANLQSTAGDTIQITRVVAEDLGEMRADPDQVRDMLTNLVSHARSALPHGGRIHVETAGVDFAGQERAGRTRRFIRLRFTYSGPAMKHEDSDRIFEPRFRTTPEEAQDLGIFMVLGVVADASGHITADVQPGVSTTFEILLPRLQEAHPIFADLETPDERSKPTILLVEDDADVRALLSTYFDRSGYRLLEAENGEDALQVSELYEGSIDLLITDMMMPVMSGPHLVEAIAADRPETRALMISGRPPDPAILREFMRQGVRFLQKPFRSTELLQLVEQILKESRVRSN